MELVLWRRMCYGDGICGCDIMITVVQEMKIEIVHLAYAIYIKITLGVYLEWNEI